MQKSVRAEGTVLGSLRMNRLSRWPLVWTERATGACLHRTCAGFTQHAFSVLPSVTRGREPARVRPGSRFAAAPGPLAHQLPPNVSSFRPRGDPAQPGLVLRHHADHTLSSFCQWQSGLTGKDGTRHDHAILLTGLDICSWKNEPCDTLGKVLWLSSGRRVRGPWLPRPGMLSASALVPNPRAVATARAVVGEARIAGQALAEHRSPR